jgi:hypothetical protein
MFDASYSNIGLYYTHEAMVFHVTYTQFNISL